MIRAWSIAAWCTVLALASSWLADGLVRAQDGEQAQDGAEQIVPPDEPPAEPTPMLKSYIALRQELQRLDDQIALYLRTIPVNDPVRRREMLAAIEQMRKRKQELTEALPQAAVQAFIESPDTYQAVTDHVVFLVRDALGETVNAQRFDPRRALELAQALCASGTKHQGLYYLAGRAAYCLHDFDLSESYFRQLAELGATVPEENWQTLSRLREAWQRELEQRAADEQAMLPRVLLKTTSGDILIELFEEQAPNTVARFIQLVEQKYYDGQIFYLNKPGKLSLTGCKRGDGTTAYEFFLPDEHQREGARLHFSGSVSMQALEPDRASCQFAILHQPDEERNGKCTVFGRVIEGLDVVFGMPPMEPQWRLSRPSTRIISATVVRKRTHGYEVEHKIPFDSPPPLIPASSSGG